MSDTVLIKSDEAAEDVNNIKNAVGKLNGSQNSIRQLKNSASSMHGQTGTAIVEQCDRLETMVNDLINVLEGNMKLINDTVTKYIDDDKALAKYFKNMGGM